MAMVPEQSSASENAPAMAVREALRSLSKEVRNTPKL
jgi:hypothetical protein